MTYFLPDFLSAVLLCVLNRQTLRPLLYCAESFTESSVQKIPAAPNSVLRIIIHDFLILVNPGALFPIVFIG